MKKNKLLITIFGLFLLCTFVSVKAESTDVWAKNNFVKSDVVFEYALTGRSSTNIDGLYISIENNNSDNGKNIVLLPLDDDTPVEEIVGNSDNYSAYYVDFYNSNGERANLRNAITISSVSGKTYDDAEITVVSTNGQVLYQGKVEDNNFSFQLTGKCYVIFNYDVMRNGDINQDQLININDLVLLRRHLAGIKVLTGKSLQLADINKDSNVNINDLVKLRKYLAGIEEL